MRPLWDIVDPKLDKSRITSQEMLWKEIQTVWRNIPKETFEKLVASMPNRIRVVIKAKGSHTKY